MSPQNAITKPCKDCGKFYSYSIPSAARDAALGSSEPERCDPCRRLHSAETKRIGVSHFKARGRDGGPVPEGISAGRLGKIHHDPRDKVVEGAQEGFAEHQHKFGVTEDDLDDLYRALQKRQVVVVEGDTGSGKSTFVPARLVSPGSPYRAALWRPRGPVVVTQPRQFATESIPRFVAELLGGSVGPGLDVGYRYRGKYEGDLSRNRIVYLTDGLALNWVVQGQNLDRIGAIMVDEAHERSERIDMLLAFLRRVLPRHPHFRVIIASATIDTKAFQDFFAESSPSTPSDDEELPKVPVIKLSGKREFSYVVEHRKAEQLPVIPYERATPKVPGDLAGLAIDAAIAKVFELLDDPARADGDILVFVNKIDQVNRTVAKIRSNLAPKHRTRVYPLHSKLSAKARLDATAKKNPGAPRRVVVSTNIAETSVTVEDLVYVIDTGLIIETNWDESREETEYYTRLHSRAGCKQRWGRAGRVADGVAFTTYTEEQFERFDPYSVPEILRCSADELMLKSKAAGFDPGRITWLGGGPSDEALRSARTRLTRAGALDGNGHITEQGLEIGHMGLEADLASVVIAADEFACSIEAVTLAKMSEDVESLLVSNKQWGPYARLMARRAHEALRAGADDDVEFLLKLFLCWKAREDDAQRIAWAERWFVNHQKLRAIDKSRHEILLQLSKGGKEKHRRAVLLQLVGRLRKVMAARLPHRVCSAVSGSTWQYSGNGRMMRLSSQSAASEARAEHVLALKQRDPGQDPVEIKTAALLDRHVDVNWALPWISRVLEVTESASIATDDHDDLVPRLLVDQWAPPGSRFTVQDKQGDLLVLGNLADPDSPADERSHVPPEDAAAVYGQAEGADDSPDDLQPDELSDAGAEEGLVSNDVADEHIDDEEFDEFPLVEELLSGEPAPFLSPPVPLLGEIQGSVQNNVAIGTLVEVVGYSRGGGVTRPAVRPSGSLGATTPGTRVELEVVEYALDPVDDRYSVLVTREVQTGVEVVLEPEDVTFSQAGWPLTWIPLGTRLSAHVSSVERGRARATLLPVVAEHRAKNSPTWGTTLVATIGYVPTASDQRDLEAILVGESDLDGGIVHVVHVPQRALARSRSDYEVGEQLELAITRSRSSVRHHSVPQGFNAHAVDQRLRWDPDERALQFSGQMTFGKSLELAGKMPTRGLANSIASLYAESNRIIAQSTHPLMEGRVRVGQTLKCRATSLHRSGIIVDTAEVGRCWVSKAELAWDSDAPTSQLAQVDDELDLVVFDLGRRGLGLSAKRMTTNPLVKFRQAPREDLVTATVTWVDPARGVHVNLAGPVRGFIPFREIPGGNGGARLRFPAGTLLDAYVLAIDERRQEVMLSLKGARNFATPARSYGLGKRQDYKSTALPRIDDQDVAAVARRSLPACDVLLAVAHWKVPGEVMGSGALVACRGTGDYGAAEALIKRDIGLHIARVVEWRDDTDAFIRDVLSRPTAGTRLDIVLNIQQSKKGTTITVRPGEDGWAIGPLGTRVQLLQRALDVQVKIVAAATPTPTGGT